MAFHTACPITSRRICYCELGFRGGLKERRAREDFLEEAFRVEEFLIDPWILRDDGGGGGGGTVDVRVPCVLPLPASPEAETEAEAAEEDEEAVPAVVVEGKVTPWALTLKARREAFQQQAAAASRAAEDYARRLESGMAAVNVSGEVDNGLVQEDEDSSTTKVICRICFSGEKEGGERAMKMLCCKMCNKKYHRSCLKTWAEYRDLFNWSSWACPSCRICEVCQRTDDPTKLMYCKRCDNAYHCYCQQPPHKNVSHGPFLCPKHTRCHSCGSTVSGSGHSTRWFLSFTCCDACGRLFVKGKYCPVCLKVYRDSEMTPMVCCDVCQQWVHCVCDGISDEKYQQFQKDGNLYYKCAACRGECYKVKDMDDAVRELWRRKDKTDCNLTARLRSAAGLPNHEDTFSMYPFSDDDESGSLLLKNNHGGSLNFLGKGFGDKSSKEYGKNFLHMSSPSTKYGKKGHRLKSIGNPEEPYQNTEKQHEPKSLKSSYQDKKSTQGKSSKSDWKGTCLAANISSPGSCREKPLVEPETSSTIKEGVVNNVKVHSGKETQSLHLKESAHKNVGNNESAKGTKFVILLGAKNRNTTSSPRFEASSCRREQEFSTVNGARLDREAATTSSEHEARENNAAEARKFSDMHRKRTNMSEEGKHSAVHRSPLILRKRSEKIEEVLPSKQSVGSPTNFHSHNHDICGPNPSDAFDDPKPLLKLKFKKPYFDKRSSWASQSVQEKNSVKGQRSKRKRPSLEKLAGFQEDGTFPQPSQQESIDEVLDANWILQKLGEGAIGKRVEVHQSSDDTWHMGVVSDVIGGSSSLSVHLDDGRPVTLELGKQGVRFIAQKQKRTKYVVSKN